MEAKPSYTDIKAVKKQFFYQNLIRLFNRLSLFLLDGFLGPVL